MNGTSLPKDNFVLNGVWTLETFVSHTDDDVRGGRIDFCDVSEWNKDAV